ncbi:MAG: hypothetical protein MK008_09595 [Bdellovibrionales bacterium]|nr:hypothetical protein [Bdellovibrionales bacterium]
MRTFAGIKIFFISFLMMGCTSAFDLNGDKVPAEMIQLETKSDGTGISVSESIQVNLSEDLNLHAIYRDENGEYIKNVEVSWRLVGNIGSLTILSNGTSAAYSSVTSGDSIIEVLYKDKVIKRVNVEVVPNPLPSLTWAATDLTVSEGTNAEFIFNISRVYGEDVTFTLSTLDNTAVAGSDYTGKSAEVITIPAGQTQVSARIATTNDSFYEVSDEVFDVNISNLNNALTSTSSGTVTIQNTDSKPSLSIADVSVAEDTGTVDVSVSLSYASEETISVDYTSADDGAVSSGPYIDFTNSSGTLTFTPGQTTKTITLNINNDSLDELDESFNVNLSNPVNASSITDNSAQVTITDNDLPPTVSIADASVNEGAGSVDVTVSLSAISGRATSVTWTANDNGAVNGQDYTGGGITQTLNIPAYTSSVNVNISILDDSDFCESNDVFNVEIFNPSGLTLGDAIASVNIIENDIPEIIITDAPSVTEGTKATYTASLSQACALDVSFDYRTYPLDAKEGHDYNYTAGTASLPSSSPTANIEVQTIDNSLYEGDQQFLLVAVQNDNLSNAKVSNTSIAVTKIIDNDTALPEPHVADFALMAGRHSACAVMGDGDVKCWGKKQGVAHFGEYNVGDETGEMGDNLDPLFVGSVAGDGVTPFTFKSIGLGTAHACGVLNDDKIKCWGSNGGSGNGGAKLGVGLADWIDWGQEVSQIGENLKYVEINATDIPVDIQAGGYMSCGLFHPSGSVNNKFVKCWGDHAYVAQGDTGSNNHIGDGQYEVRDLPALDFGATAGVYVNQLSVGFQHSCVLLDNGNAYCWGENTHGQIGINTAKDYVNSYTNFVGDDDNEVGTSFQKVIDNGVSITQISAGRDHTCALFSNNRAKCWGWGSNGELGDGNEGYSHKRGNTSGDMEALNFINVGTTDGTTPRNVKMIKAGSDHTCVILADNNQVKCFGENNYGQLGLGNTDDKVWGSELGDNLAEVDLGTGLSAKDLYLGEDFTCAILNNDQIKCWGRNHKGQLGYEHTNNIGDDAGEIAAAPTVNLGTARTAVAFSGGYNHVGVCVLLDNGEVKCWGSNSYNNFARNDIAFGDEPGEMGANLPNLNIASGVKARQISLNEAKCIISTDGEVYCWGEQWEGALANGNNDREIDIGRQIHDLGNFPKAMTPSSLKALQLESSDRTTCVLFDDFTVRCWGDGGYGRPGIGIATNQNVEYSSQLGDNLTAINFGTDLYPISLTSSHRGFCAILSDQSVKCWGANTYGMLGIESSVSELGDDINDMGDNWESVKFGTTGFLSNKPAVKKVVGSRYSYCALFENEKIKCWGYNRYGQLGYEDETDRGGSAGSMGDNLDFVNVGTNVMVKDIFGSIENYRYCAITDADEVKCWGSDQNIGLLGLGYPTSTDRGDAVGEMGDNLQTSITGTTLVQSVYGNYDATCALYVNGQLKCWTAINQWGIGGQGHDNPLSATADIGDNMPFIDLE